MSVPNQRRSSRIQQMLDRQDTSHSTISADVDSSQTHDNPTSAATSHNSQELDISIEEPHRLAEALQESTISEEVDRADGGPREERDTSLDCAICLQPCVHPAKLPCSHIFCFLCLKGFAQQSRRCAMCRTPIPHDYLERPELVEVPEPSSLDNGYQWFYEGRNGWWQYDDRTSQELELNYQAGERLFELLIAGNIYVIDFHDMVQYRKVDTIRKRRIKRDILLNASRIKGIAGLRLGNELDRSAVPQPVSPDNWLLNDHNYSIPGVVAPLRRVRVEASSILDPRGWIRDTDGSDIDDSSRHDHLYTRREMNQPSQPVSRSEAPSSQHPSLISSNVLNQWVGSIETPPSQHSSSFLSGDVRTQWVGPTDVSSSQHYPTVLSGSVPLPLRTDPTPVDRFVNVPYARELNELIHFTGIVSVELRHVRSIMYHLYNSSLMQRQSQIEISRSLENLLIYVDQALLHPCLLRLSQIIGRNVTSPSTYAMHNAALQRAFDCTRHSADFAEVSRMLREPPRYNADLSGATLQGQRSEDSHMDMADTRHLSRLEAVARRLFENDEHIRATADLIRSRLVTYSGWIRVETDLERSRSNCFHYMSVCGDLQSVVNALLSFLQSNSGSAPPEVYFPNSLPDRDELLRNNLPTIDRSEDTATRDVNDCHCRTCARSDQFSDSSQQFTEAEQDRSSSEYSNEARNSETLVDRVQTQLGVTRIDSELPRTPSDFSETNVVEPGPMLQGYACEMCSFNRCQYAGRSVRDSEFDRQLQITRPPMLQGNRPNRSPRDNEHMRYVADGSASVDVSTPSQVNSGLMSSQEFHSQRQQPCPSPRRVSASSNVPDACVETNSNGDSNPLSCPPLDRGADVANLQPIPRRQSHASSHRSRSSFETDSIERNVARSDFDARSSRGDFNDLDSIDRNYPNEEYSVDTRSSNGMDRRRQEMSGRPVGRWWGDGQGSGRIAFAAVENGEYHFDGGLYYLDEDADTRSHVTNVNPDLPVATLNSRNSVTDVHPHHRVTAANLNFGVTDTIPQSRVTDLNAQSRVTDLNAQSRVSDLNAQSRVTDVQPHSRISRVTRPNLHIPDVIEEFSPHSRDVSLADTFNVNNSENDGVGNEGSINQIPFDHQYSSAPDSRQARVDPNRTTKNESYHSRELDRSVSHTRDCARARVAVDKRHQTVDSVRGDLIPLRASRMTPPPSFQDPSNGPSLCDSNNLYPNEPDRDSVLTTETDNASERDRRETRKLFRNSVKNARLEEINEQSGSCESHDSQNGTQQPRQRNNKNSNATQITTSTVCSVPNAQSEFYFGNDVLNHNNTLFNHSGNSSVNRNDNTVFNRNRNTGVSFNYDCQDVSDHVLNLTFNSPRRHQETATSLPYYFREPHHNQDVSVSMPYYINEPHQSQESPMSMPHFTAEPRASFSHACPMAEVSSWYGDLAPFARSDNVDNATSHDTEREALNPRRESTHPSGSYSSDNSSHNTSQVSSSERDYDDCSASSSELFSHSTKQQSLNQSPSDKDARRLRNYESYDNFGFEDILSQTNLSFNAKVFVPKGSAATEQASNEIASHPQSSVVNERSERFDSISENGSSNPHFFGPGSEIGSTHTYFFGADSHSENGSTNNYLFGSDAQSEIGSTNNDDVAHCETESTTAHSFARARENSSPNTYYFGFEGDGTETSTGRDMKTEAQTQEEMQERSVDERTIKHSYTGERTLRNEDENTGEPVINSGGALKHGPRKEEEGAKGYAETIVKHFVHKGSGAKNSVNNRDRRLTVMDHNYAAKEKLSRQDSEHSYACKKLKSSRSDRKLGGNLSKSCAVDTEHAYSRHSKSGALLDHEYAKVWNESCLVDQMNYLTLRESTTDEEDEDL